MTSLWYMTTEKTIALTVWIFVNKVMSLPFNTLSCDDLPSLVAQLVKNLPAMQETLVQFLVQG